MLQIWWKSLFHLYTPSGITHGLNPLNSLNQRCGQQLALGQCAMSFLEQAIEDRRVQICAAILGFVVLAISAGFLIASKAEPKTMQTSQAHAFTNVPILRSLNQGQPMRSTTGVLSYSRPAQSRTAQR